tara:strand:- start:2704 stop:3117 length:414 start_codon:yes stop_codon:yes gene_type:complete
MGEEFYTVIKLITGEEIFALVTVDDNDGDPIILMQKPVIMQMKFNHIGHYVKIKPWLTIPTDDLYVLKYDKIVTMSEVTDEQTIEFYNRYINNDDVDIELDGKVKVSDKMGFISTVDDARKNLENLYNLPTNPTKES